MLGQQQEEEDGEGWYGSQSAEDQIGIGGREIDGKS